jgi:hypothetical protein
LRCGCIIDKINTKENIIDLTNDAREILLLANSDG